MPRPSKPAADSRRHFVRFRVTETELSALRTEAAQAGLSVHEQARANALASGLSGQRVGAPAAHPHAPELAEFNLQLIRIGSNLNQIARRLNAAGDHHPPELAAVLKTINDILRRALADVVFP